MQTCSKLVLTILAAACLAGCDQAKQNTETDEKAIRSAAKAYQEAYNQQDVAKMVALFAKDASYINPFTGESADGKEAIEKLFKGKFDQGEKKHLDVTIKHIEFPNADEAIEKGVMGVSGDGLPPQQLAYQVEYTKEQGKWLVKAINEIELLKPSSNFEHLQDLAWLVGKWEDADDNVEISFDNQWDKYKNFLTQNFRMKVYGQDDIEGKQIIAWDPVKSKVRSWVFDSDGEFGEGTWEKVDKSWYATMRFTLSDGRIATATNIYTPVNDRSYTFASVERDVDGEVLPDLSPVTVEKVE